MIAPAFKSASILKIIDSMVMKQAYGIPGLSPRRHIKSAGRTADFQTKTF